MLASLAYFAPSNGAAPGSQKSSAQDHATSSIVLAGNAKLANAYGAGTSLQTPKSRPGLPDSKTTQRTRPVSAPPKSASPFALWFAPPAEIVPAVAPKPVVTYRTVCVRLCDGSFFPISYATTRDRFAADEKECRSSCSSPARLFAYESTSGSLETMQDRDGKLYSELATAFQFRTSFDASCTCKAHPWQQEAKDRHQMYALLEAQKKNKGNAAIAVEIASLRAKYGETADAVLGRAVLASNNSKVTSRKQQKQAMALAVAAELPLGAIGAPQVWSPKMGLGAPSPKPAAAPSDKGKRVSTRAASPNDIILGALSR